MTEEERKKDVASVTKRETELEDIKKKQRALKKSLRAADLQLHSFLERSEEDKKAERRQFVLIGAGKELLENAAEAIGLEKRLKQIGKKQSPQYEAFAEYKKIHHHRFQEDRYGGFFTSLERIRCIFHLIESPTYAEPGCAAVDLDRLIAEGVISGYYCLMDKPRLEDLKTTWIYQNLLKPAPVAMIRDYLGEKIALYFAWMHTYTSYLGVLGVISLVPFTVQMATRGHGERTFDNWAVPIYGLITVVWAQAFLEHWKREQAKLTFKWNMEDFEDEEVLRPEFRQEVERQHHVWNTKHDPNVPKEELSLVLRVCDPPVAGFKKGRWSRAGFVEVDSDDELAKDLDEVEWFDEWFQQIRMVISASIAIFLVCIIVLGTIALMALKVKLATHGEFWKENSALVSAFLNSAFITVMSIVWSYVGIILNDWEMHRTDTEWEDSLITKTFAFQFINSYVASLYIAAVQGSQVKLPFFRGAHGSVLRDHCIADDCFRALYYQMAMLVISKQVTRHLLVIAPIILSWFYHKFFPKPEENSKLHAMVIEQSRLVKFTGTHNEYLEMVIQFGYVSMFAVAFPIGSLIVFINNLLEKRSDAAKVTLLSQRPKYLGAQDIGTVQNMLEVVALSACFTNLIILYLSSTAYESYFPEKWSKKPRFNLLIATVAIEHIVILLKQFVNWVVPDTPSWVEIERARNKMRRNALVELSEKQKALQQKHKSRFTSFADVSSDDDEDE